MAAWQEAADAAAALPPVHQLLSTRAEQRFFEAAAAPAAPALEWRAATAPPQAATGAEAHLMGSKNTAAEASDDFELPVRRAVSACGVGGMPPKHILFPGMIQR